MGVDVKDITPYDDLAEVVSGVVKATGKPIMLVLPNFKQGSDALDIEVMIRKARNAFLSRSIPVYDTLENALGTLSNVSAYYSRMNMRQNI